MKDNLDELLPLVDEEGTVIGFATRGECHNGMKPLHPVVHLYVFSFLGELYLQKRPLWKEIQPGKWDMSVGGHVEYGETPENALRREMYEELGMIDIKTRFVGKHIYESQRERELVYVYVTLYQESVCPSKDELDDGRFWTMREIYEAMGKEVLTPNLEEEIEWLAKLQDIVKFTQF